MNRAKGKNMKTRTMLMVGLAVCGQAVAGTYVMESARKIPLVKLYDLKAITAPTVI